MKRVKKEEQEADGPLWASNEVQTASGESTPEQQGLEGNLLRQDLRSPD